MTERILFHSVFLQCPSCNVWGTPFPNDTECGNCGNSDGTVTYVSQEDSNAQAAEKVRQALDRLENYQINWKEMDGLDTSDSVYLAISNIMDEVQKIRKELG